MPASAHQGGHAEFEGDSSDQAAPGGVAQNLAAAGLFATPHVNLRGVPAEGDHPNLGSPAGWPTGGNANGTAAAAFNAALAAEVSQSEQLPEPSLLPWPEEFGEAEGATEAAAAEQPAVDVFEFSLPASAAAATPCLSLAGRMPAARGWDELGQPHAAAASPDAMDAWMPASTLHDAFAAAAPAVPALPSAAFAAAPSAAVAAAPACNSVLPLMELPVAPAADGSELAAVLATLLPEGLPADGCDSHPPSLQGSRPASPRGAAPLLPAAASSAAVPCSDTESVCSQAATPAAAALAQLGSLYINEKTGQIMQR